MDTISTNFFEKFKENVKKWDLLPEGSSVIMWYSGGKDSCALLDLLLRFKEDRNFSLEAYLAAIPHLVYKSKDRTQQEAMQANLDYWANRGIKINILNPVMPDGRAYKDDGELDAFPTKCWGCEKIKSASTLNAVIRAQKKDFTIVTTHNTYDVLGYVMEMVHIAGGFENGWQDLEPGSLQYNRVMTLAGRCYPKFALKRGLTITQARPLIDFSGPSIKGYIDERQIPLIPECCPKIGGDGFRIFKRVPMEGADLIIKIHPESDGPRFAEDYGRIMRFARDAKVLPPVEDVAANYPQSASY